MKKHRRRSTKPTIQTHHITYNPERTVVVWRGEHYVLTQLQWRKRISKGFIEALEDYILTHKAEAYELTVTQKLVNKNGKN